MAGSRSGDGMTSNTDGSIGYFAVIRTRGWPGLRKFAWYSDPTDPHLYPLSVGRDVSEAWDQLLRNYNWADGFEMRGWERKPKLQRLRRVYGCRVVRVRMEVIEGERGSRAA